MILWAFILLFSIDLPQNNPYCRIFGSVYEVDEPYKADFLVYLSASETSSDIIVFEQQNRLYADKMGMWFFEEQEEFATHKIYFTERERDADFSIYLTRFESFAGCNE